MLLNQVLRILVYFRSDDPQDAEVAKQYKLDPELFAKTARTWTENFAKEVTVEDKVKRMTEMGFTEDQCMEALDRYDYDEEKALNYLLGD